MYYICLIVCLLVFKASDRSKALTLNIVYYSCLLFDSINKACLWQYSSYPSLFICCLTRYKIVTACRFHANMYSLTELFHVFAD